MKTPTFLSLGFALVLISTSFLITTSSAPHADSNDVKSQQTAFARSFVAAVQSKNRAAVLGLLHPALRACMAGADRSFFDTIVTQQMDGFPTTGYTNLTMTPVAPTKPPSLWAFVPEKSFPYPIKPTYQIQIDFSADPNGLFGDVLEVAPSGQSWYWITACPNADGMRLMRKMQDEAAQQKAKGKKVASELRDPLLSKIKSLLANHDRVGAIKAYIKATGADASTAASVIDAIQNPR